MYKIVAIAFQKGLFETTSRNLLKIYQVNASEKLYGIIGIMTNNSCTVILNGTRCYSSQIYSLPVE